MSIIDIARKCIAKYDAAQVAFEAANKASAQAILDMKAAEEELSSALVPEIQVEPAQPSPPALPPAQVPVQPA